MGDLIGLAVTHSPRTLAAGDSKANAPWQAMFPFRPLLPLGCGGAPHDFRLMQRETGIG